LGAVGETKATGSIRVRRTAPGDEAVPTALVSRLVYGAALLWAVGFAVAAAIRYSLFLDRRYDLGNFTQAVWSTAHGHLLQVTEVGGAQVSRLGIHVDPILVLFAPLWWVWPSPVLLLVVQAFALAAGALPLYWLARKHLRRQRDAAFVAVAYLLCPTVGWNALFEFHPVALAVPLLLLSIWFLDEARLAAFLLAAVGAMMCQEQVGLIIACLGLWYGLTKRRLKSGLGLASVGLLVSAIDFGVILRHFSGGSPYLGRYKAAGGSWSEIVRNVFAHPVRIARTVDGTDLLEILILVCGVLGLCFASAITLAALPQVVLLTLSDNPVNWSFSAQNVLLLIPFVYAGAVLALARRERRGVRLGPRIRADHILVASVALAVSLGPFDPFGAYIGEHSPYSSRVKAERHAVDLIPPNASVSATNHLGSHLSARRYIYVFPVVKRANWIVVDIGDDFLPDIGFLHTRKSIAVGKHDLYWQPKLMADTVRGLLRSPHWRTVYASSTIFVFARRPLHAT
jgi:uncharacterized membrane protein